MSRLPHKYKLLLDENMPGRDRFPRLNSRFNVRHLVLDYRKRGITDPAVYALAVQEHRLVVPFNGDDFKALATQSKDTGVISLSANLSLDHIDKKLTALLTNSAPTALLGKFTALTGETGG